MAGRIKLGELLVRAGVLDDFKLKAALAEQQRWGGRLGRILVEMNFVSEDLLVKALSKQLGVPRARLDTVSLPQEIVSKIDPQFAVNNAVCPERYLPDKKTLVIAMADPTNMSAIDELRFKTGLRIETALAGELEITQAIDRIFYGRAPIDGLELHPGGIDQSADLAYRASLTASSTRFDQRNADPFNSAFAAALPQVPTFSPPPPSPMGSNAGSARPLQGAASQRPTERPMGSGISFLPPVATAPMGPPPSNNGPENAWNPGLPRGGAAPSALELAVALDAAQKKQVKAIRIMLELLIEKGVFSRDEYIDLVNKR